MTGRVLDTLGMAYAYKGSFPVAREFFEQSIRYKGRFDDEAGIAISHGQLGRLYLEWGHLDEAERHFREGMSWPGGPANSTARPSSATATGQVLLARGRPEEAAAFLDESIRLARRRFLVIEGYAHKDRGWRTSP